MAAMGATCIRKRFPSCCYAHRYMMPSLSALRCLKMRYLQIKTVTAPWTLMSSIRGILVQVARWARLRSKCWHI
jgi:hypothetical protein|eukprot:COSAG06_NODE_282_length_18378_cov_85.787461_3_plen_74_part_00